MTVSVPHKIQISLLITSKYYIMAIIIPSIIL